MQNGMTIQELLIEVQRQATQKRDFVADTHESIRMVADPLKSDDVCLVLLSQHASELQRFEITEHCHRQIAARLDVPWKFYSRLLQDHRDLVIHNVNELFEREPSMRLVRTLDGKARAFLSDRYRRLDNDEVLSHVLPPLIRGDIESTLLNTHISENKMRLKVLFTNDELKIDLGETAQRAPWGGADVDAQHRVIAQRDSGRDIVRPGCEISNSETGDGSLRIRGFFFRSYCLNGCVFGDSDAFTYSRNHVGSKLLSASNLEVFSDETQRKQDELIIAECRDALKLMSDPTRVQKMGDALRAAKFESEHVRNAAAAVSAVVTELPQLLDADRDNILESFIRDQDYSKWGMLNAITAQANSEAITYERACEYEEAGAQLLNLSASAWGRIASLEKVAA